MAADARQADAGRRRVINKNSMLARTGGPAVARTREGHHERTVRGHRRFGPSQGGPALHLRPRPLHRRHQPSRPVARRHQAQRPAAREDPVASTPRRRRRRPAWWRSTPARTRRRSAAFPAAGRSTTRTAARWRSRRHPDAGRRLGAPCRRPDRRGDRRDQAAGQGRGRTAGHRVRGPARGRQRDRRDRAGRRRGARRRVAGNVCYDWHIGDKAAMDAAFAQARATSSRST